MPTSSLALQGDAATRPALVLGTGISVLGTVRLLGRAGIPVLVAEPEPGPVAGSRWYRPADAAVPIDRAPDLPTFLEGLSVERAVIVPCSDDSALQVARLPEVLGARFPSSNPPAETLELLVDKGRFRDLLVRLGTPHPATILLDTPDQLEELPEEAWPRAFVKPRDSAAFFRRFGVKGVRPGSPDELRRVVAELCEARVGLMIQEYVPGPASNHYFVDGFRDRNGQVRGVLVRQRLRMYPLDFGNSSAMVTVPPEQAADAVASLRTLLEALGYRGIFSAEFKRDERDGVFRLLEINARAWWYIEYAGRCGLDTATMAYRDALELPVADAPPYEVGRRLVYPYYDIQAGYHLLRRRPAGLFGFARSWIGAELSVFAVDDPMPAIAGLARGAASLVRRRILRR